MYLSSVDDPGVELEDAEVTDSDEEGVEEWTATTGVEVTGVESEVDTGGERVAATDGDIEAGIAQLAVFCTELRDVGGVVVTEAIGPDDRFEDMGSDKDNVDGVVMTDTTGLDDGFEEHDEVIMTKGASEASILLDGGAKDIGSDGVTSMK